MIAAKFVRIIQQSLLIDDIENNSLKRIHNVLFRINSKLLAIKDEYQQFEKPAFHKNFQNNFKQTTRNLLVNNNGKASAFAPNTLLSWFATHDATIK